MFVTFGLLTAAVIAALVVSHHMNSAKGVKSGPVISATLPTGQTVAVQLPAHASPAQAAQVQKAVTPGASAVDLATGAKVAQDLGLDKTAAVMVTKIAAAAKAAGIGLDIDYGAYGPAYGVRVPQVIEQSQTIDDPAYGLAYGTRTPIDIK
jgi:hypothetical protein